MWIESSYVSASLFMIHFLSNGVSSSGNNIFVQILSHSFLSCKCWVAYRCLSKIMRSQCIVSHVVYMSVCGMNREGVCSFFIYFDISWSLNMSRSVSHTLHMWLVNTKTNQCPLSLLWTSFLLDHYCFVYMNLLCCKDPSYLCELDHKKHRVNNWLYRLVSTEYADTVVCLYMVHWYMSWSVNHTRHDPALSYCEWNSWSQHHSMSGMNVIHSVRI